MVDRFRKRSIRSLHWHLLIFDQIVFFVLFGTCNLTYFYFIGVGWSFCVFFAKFRMRFRFRREQNLPLPVVPRKRHRMARGTSSQKYADNLSRVACWVFGSLIEFNLNYCDISFKFFASDDHLKRGKDQPVHRLDRLVELFCVP